MVDDWKHEPVEFKETSGNLQQAKKVQLLVSYDYKLHSQMENMADGYNFAKAKKQHVNVYNFCDISAILI